MRQTVAVVGFVCVIGPLIHARETDPTPKATWPGATKDGFLLPNGWRLSPVGRHVTITDVPLNIILLSDNRHALMASNGDNSHDLALVRLTDEPKIVSRETARQSWFGLAVNKDESKV
jgi:hypothetical protein